MGQKANQRTFEVLRALPGAAAGGVLAQPGESLGSKFFTGFGQTRSLPLPSMSRGGREISAHGGTDECGGDSLLCAGGQGPRLLMLMLGTQAALESHHSLTSSVATKADQSVSKTALPTRLPCKPGCIPSVQMNPSASNRCHSAVAPPPAGGGPGSRGPDPRRLKPQLNALRGASPRIACSGPAAELSSG